MRSLDAHSKNKFLHDVAHNNARLHEKWLLSYMDQLTRFATYCTCAQALFKHASAELQLSIMIWTFICYDTLCLLAAKALSRLCFCASSSSPSLLRLSRCAMSTNMRGSKKIKRGSTSDNVFLVDERREDPNTTKKAYHHRPAKR